MDNNIKHNIIEIFEKFPGIGSKQAERFYYFIIRQNDKYVNNFINNLQKVKDNSHRCIYCKAYYSMIQSNERDNNLCSICSSNSRDNGLLMILEKEMDINAVEKTEEYNGLYFIMGGKLPHMVKDPKEHINIEGLVQRIITDIKADKLKEIIFALPVNDDGDYEENYIRKIISQVVNIDKVKISKLARGVSTGLEMEYVDKDTFKEAFGRRG
ncbi:MAG: toprim domain-containing protein [Cyanobium sp. MAG06]|nr:toprim domain-containing protein [Cyanobium sp. MAG06]